MSMRTSSAYARCNGTSGRSSKRSVTSTGCSSPGPTGSLSASRPPWMPATKNENQVAARSSSVSTGGSFPSATKMSRSWSHESQNACVKRKRAGMWPNGDSPIPSQSDTSNSATKAMNASLLATNCASTSAGGSVRSGAMTGSSEFDGSKPRRNVVAGAPSRAFVSVMIQNWSAVTMCATTSLTFHSVQRVSACHCASGSATSASRNRRRWRSHGSIVSPSSAATVTATPS